MTTDHYASCPLRVSRTIGIVAFYPLETSDSRALLPVAARGTTGREIDPYLTLNRFPV